MEIVLSTYSFSLEMGVFVLVYIKSNIVMFRSSKILEEYR